MDYNDMKQEEYNKMMGDYYRILQEVDEKMKTLKKEWRLKLKGLINVTGLYNDLDFSVTWSPLGIVEIYPTDEKSWGYSSYEHVRIKDTDDKHLYLKQSCDIRGINHCCVYQTSGYCEDDYSGFQLFPLKNGKYFKIDYSC